MSQHSVIAEILLQLAAVMREANLRWYLFGAQAAIIWGSPRLSADLDVTVALEAVPSFIEAMERQGFHLLLDDPELFSRTRVLPFVHRASRVPVDVVLAGPGLEEEFQARAVAIAIGDARIPVISAEDLIVTKVLAGRPKDIEDVRGVLRARVQELDLERIRSMLGLLEQALTRSDLLAVFEAELQKVK